MLSAAVTPPRRILIVAAGLVVVSVALFMLIAEDLLDGGGLISRDVAVLRWFVDHRSDAWISAAQVASTVGSFVSLLLMGVALGLWLWWRRWHPALATATLVSLLISGLAASVMKAVFDRPRPPIAFHATATAAAAFPSGHATDAAGFFLAAALVLALTIAHRRIAQLASIAIGLLLAALVGLSRLVLGVHWLSDVIAGWALGTAIATTVVVTAWYATSRANQRGQRKVDAPPTKKLRTSPMP
jgi:undecaprenyl-diphosphatase